MIYISGKKKWKKKAVEKSQNQEQLLSVCNYKNRKKKRANAFISIAVPACTHGFYTCHGC